MRVERTLAGIACQCLDPRWFGAAAAHYIAPATGPALGKWASKNAPSLTRVATGLGITANIIDCYAAIIRLYEPGDRIFLIGFSRGAYTVRSLAGVISYCGIARQLPRGASLRLDLEGSHELAEHAVKDVYQFCSSYDRTKVGHYLQFMLRTDRKSVV